MLGFLIAEGRGEADRILFDLATRLHDQGWSLAGAVQSNDESRSTERCDMDLHVLSMERVIRISQNLGSLAKGCRLDPAALEQAVALAEQAVAGTPRLCIVNKFGKAEIDGKGFRPLIGEAIAKGIPVLTSVSRGNLPAFQDFAEGMAEQIAPDPAAVLDWCRSQSA